MWPLEGTKTTKFPLIFGKAPLYRFFFGENTVLHENKVIVDYVLVTCIHTCVPTSVL